MKIKILDMSPVGPVYHADISDEAYAAGCAEWGEQSFVAIIQEAVLSKVDWDLAMKCEPHNAASTYHRIKAKRRGWAVDD